MHTVSAVTSRLNSLLAVLSPAQQTALIDALSMHIENVECDDEATDDALEATLVSEGHIFLVAMRDAAIVHITSA